MITFVLIGLNSLIFILTVISDPTFLMHPSIQSIITWGGLETELVMNGEWWRLITSMFIHLGIIHFLSNMYALFIIGSFLESIVGKVTFLTIYLTTGILSGLWSFLMHIDTLYISAGASGAIAGIFGTYIFILLTPMIAKEVRDKLLKNVVYVIAVNVGYGMSRGMNIDHAAHLGGLVSGLSMGGIFYLSFHLWINKFKFILKKAWLKWVSAGAVVTLTLVITFSTLYTQQSSDYALFSKLVKEYETIEKNINTHLKELDLQNNADYILSDLDAHITPEIKQAKHIKDEMISLKLHRQKDILRNYFVDYIDLYDQRFHLWRLAIQKNTPNYNLRIQHLDDKMKKLNETFKEAIKQ